MYDSLGIYNIDYVLILSVSRSPSYFMNGKISVTPTVNRYIQYYSICQTLTSSVIAICEVTVRTISIIVHLSNTLQRILAVVRTSTYNNTACILRTVSMVLWHLPSEGVYSRLSMYYGMALIDF